MNATNATALADHTVKFLASTTGRDRINRFLQYFARFLAWHLARSGADKERLAQVAGFMAAFGMTRKVMRTGRQLEFYRGAVKSLALKDSVLKVTTVAKSLFMAVWLSFDTCQWLHTAGVHKFTNIKEIGTRANQSWLMALLFSLVGDIYKLHMNHKKLVIERKVAHQAPGKDESVQAKKTVKALLVERRKVAIATVQDSVDLLLPTSGLEYIQVESGVVGLAGAFTSLLGGCEFFFCTFSPLFHILILKERVFHLPDAHWTSL
ncbi:Peroxisomal membrane protein PMP27 [Podochytrium sp. JEL0797]|nr:Peroxisomal membrane protein PMP27 [Podochytrium sp. JEL0797]